MKPSPLDHKYRLAASSPNYDDFCALLALEAEQAADVRNKLTGPDSLEIRTALATRLQQIIDKIKRTRKNEYDRHSESDDESM